MLEGSYSPNADIRREAEAVLKSVRATHCLFFCLFSIYLYFIFKDNNAGLIEEEFNGFIFLRFFLSAFLAGVPVSLETLL